MGIDPPAACLSEDCPSALPPPAERVLICATLLLAGVLAGVPSAATAALDPASLVNPLIGTENNGHTFPGATTPFGMVQFSPVSPGGGAGGYRYSEHRVSGFALTRLSGAGCTNYGDVPLMPVTAPPTTSPAAVSAAFSHRDESAQPGSYRVTLSNGIAVALAATTRTGLGVFTYPASTRRGTLLIDPSGSANHRTATIQVVGRDRVLGSATSAAFGGPCGHPPGAYTVYFALRFEQPFASFGTWSGDRLAPRGREQNGAKAGAYVTFDTHGDAAVGVKVGLSFVSEADAVANLAAEATSWSFSTVESRARARWDQLLGRIRISGGMRAEEVVFYTALYHALLSPNVYSDANGRYLGGDGRIHTANGYTRYTNFSEWDIYRGEMQLLSLLAPRQASDMIRSLVADGQEAGQLPRWPVAGSETALMVGDPSDAVIADAYAFGARGFDANLALREMLVGAGIPQPEPASNAGGRYAERPGLAAYLRFGYIPGAPSTTLEYSIADFAVSQLAAALGDGADSQTLLARSGSWRNTLDPAIGLVEPRLSDGTFPAASTPTSTSGFVEGDASQYTFMVPQDVAGLLAALGPPGTAERRLVDFFTKLNAGPTSAHAWLGNEPSLLTPYDYLWLGLPWRSEQIVHRALTRLFADRPDGLPGNDDLGALSSWYVWSALGLYPAVPAVAGLAVIAPLFPHVTIDLPNQTSVDLWAPQATAGGRYIRSLRVDGEPYDASWLPLSRIDHGGTLRFTLGAAPSSWATAPGSAPPSYSAASPGP